MAGHCPSQVNTSKHGKTTSNVRAEPACPDFGCASEYKVILQACGFWLTLCTHGPEFPPITNLKHLKIQVLAMLGEGGSGECALCALLQCCAHSCVFKACKCGLCNLSFLALVCGCVWTFTSMREHVSCLFMFAWVCARLCLRAVCVFVCVCVCVHICLCVCVCACVCVPLRLRAGARACKFVCASSVHVVALTLCDDRRYILY
jgi:hypothetical protein